MASDEVKITYRGKTITARKMDVPPPDAFRRRVMIDIPPPPGPSTLGYSRAIVFGDLKLEPAEENDRHAK
jgi:hypothetical protein